MSDDFINPMGDERGVVYGCRERGDVTSQMEETNCYKEQTSNCEYERDKRKN